ncbi:ABC-three component system middle component 5 [Pedobacter sp. Hv1]|uniref:ABC-three component system middle component 5 n=1 Tax=Pedobacter sp. Hv1 TaxID=1740090 RepID=UPI0006D8D046|nr:ABC-three component system middle component 5 [Pedobacter sp. Hv1]KQC02026.1 hypothetical protein AQF98_00175 [Pedobacter sp. Hv1]
MIVYNQAFDYYHAIYRMIRLLTHVKKDDFVELDRLRIWDFYLLFPEQIHTITLKDGDKDIKELRARFVKQRNNPYNQVFDNKKVFEKLRPYQLTALQCLASYGIINKDLLKENRVSIISREILKDYEGRFEELSYTEQNIITMMVYHFSSISMFGTDGLKSRTKLMVSKYDYQ